MPMNRYTVGGGFMEQFIKLLTLDVIIRLSSYLIAAIVLSILYGGIINRLLKINQGKKKSQTIYRLLSNVGTYLIWFIAIILVLETLNVQTAPILASAGVLGIAVGFGAQKIVQDMISGFFILFDETFLLGESVEISGFRGEVMEIGLRTTKLKSWDGVLKIFNNGDISAVSNYSRYPALAIIDFQVAYETNLKKLPALMDEFINDFNHPSSTETLQFLGITELADSGITCRLIGKTKPNDQHGLTRDVRLALKEFLDSKKIDIPYPHIIVQQKAQS
jgi:moderate conductance mechanosensitive channel